MRTKIYVILSMALMLIAPTSCIYDKDVPCGSEGTESLVLNLNLTVPSSAPGSRSAGDELAPGTKDESFINVADGDYRVLLFDKNGALVEDKLSDFKCKENGLYAGDVCYQLTANLTLDDDNDRERLSKFKVMVLANWQSFEKSNTNAGFEYPTFTSYSLTDGAADIIYNEKNNLNFTLKTQSPNSSWMPSETNKRGIPMFGVTDELILEHVIELSKNADEPSFYVPMLRSVAKIEISNKTPAEDEVTIKGCRLMACNSKGRVIPMIDANTNKEWSDLYTQISTASLPGAYDSDGSQLDMQNLEFVTLDGGKTYVAYLPEIDFDKIKEQLGEDAIPQIEIELEAEGDMYEYQIDLGQYNATDGKFSGTHYSALLRNHKYIFNINKVEIGAKGNLTLQIDTQEWDVDNDQEWAYEDAAVGFTDGGAFEWIDPEYEFNLDDPDRILIVGHEPDKAAYGHFQFKPLASNNSCTWTISLIADDDTNNNHFNIWLKKNSGTVDDEWENCGDTVTRDIDPNMVEFRIMATEANGSPTDYAARLVMTVQTFDGRVAILNLTGTQIYDSNSDKFYYVVKQPTNGGDNM